MGKEETNQELRAYVAQYDRPLSEGGRRPLDRMEAAYVAGAKEELARREANPIRVQITTPPVEAEDSIPGTVKFQVVLHVHGERFEGLVVQRQDDERGHGETMIRGPLYHALAERWGWEGERWEGPDEHWVYALGKVIRQSLRGEV